MIHDWGKIANGTKKVTGPKRLELYKISTKDGGISWSYPTLIWKSGTISIRPFTTTYGH